MSSSFCTGRYGKGPVHALQHDTFKLCRVCSVCHRHIDIVKELADVHGDTGVPGPTCSQGFCGFVTFAAFSTLSTTGCIEGYFPRTAFCARCGNSSIFLRVFLLLLLALDAVVLIVFSGNTASKLLSRLQGFFCT